MDTFKGPLPLFFFNIFPSGAEIMYRLTVMIISDLVMDEKK